MPNLLSNVFDIRSQFPIFKDRPGQDRLAYLDNGASTQKPNSVIDRMTQFYRNEYATVHRGVYTLSQNSTQAYDDARKTVKEFINAESIEEIVFVRGTTEAINLVAGTFGRHFLNAGDEILVSEIEHHANFVPWQQLAIEKGIRLIICPVNDAGELIFSEFEKRLSAKTKLVAITHVSNVLGSIFPVEQIIKKAHAVGAKVLLDGAQAIQHLKVNVKELDCDFYAFSGHKLYGPTGIGVLFAKQSLFDKMPPYQTGGDMIESVTIDKTTFAKGAIKFEAGTPDFVGAIGLGAAIEFMNSIDPNYLKIHEKELLRYATERLASEPDIRIIGTAQNKIAVISFVIDGIHPHDVGTILDSEGVAVRVGHHCSQIAMARFKVPATIRASFGIYNTAEDVDQLIASLKTVRKLLT